MNDEQRDFEVSDAKKPTVNGRIYPEPLLKEMSEQINSRPPESPMLGELYDAASDGEIRLTKVSHEILPTSRVVDDKLVVTVKALDTPAGRALEDFLKSGRIRAVPRGTGVVSADGIVSNYRLTSVDFCWNDDA